MFDPTAFENLRVVLEGALYDLDLNDEILITDRNDFINTAKLSRKYEIYFTLTDMKGIPITARLELESTLENLAAELLPGSLSEKRSGCSILLGFSFTHRDRIVDYERIEKILLDIWGSNRKIIQTVSFYPLQKEKSWRYDITVIFDRLIYENQIDDLVGMIQFMVTTLYRLQSMLNR